MKRTIFYKKIINGENTKTFLMGIPFSYKKKTDTGYVAGTFFGLFKAKHKNYATRYYILGILFFKKTMNFDKAITKLIEKYNFISRQNFINLFFLKNTDFNVFYIQSENVLYIFSNKICHYDNVFFHEYLVKNIDMFKCFNFKIMSPKCILYKEHADQLLSGKVLLYKYIKRGGLVYKNIISYDDNDSSLFLESSYLGLENYQSDNGCLFLNTSQRKILKGVTVSDALKTKNNEEQKRLLKTFFNWLFKTYQNPDNQNKLDGILLDCNLENFLISDGEFIQIDKEFYFEPGLSKDECLWYALGRKCVGSPHYEYLTEYYGLKKLPTSYPYPSFWPNKISLEKTAYLNQDLTDRYFTEKNLIPIDD